MSPNAGMDGVGNRLRWPVAAALVGAALSHLPVIAVHLREAPYLGIAFVAFVVTAGALAVAVLAGGSPWCYAATAWVCGAAVTAYGATRLVAFPQVADDMGNWWEPAGVASVLSELAAMWLALSALRLQRPTTVPVRRRCGRVSVRLAAASAMALGLAGAVPVPAGAVGRPATARAAAPSPSGSPTLAKFTEQLTVPPTVDLTAGGGVTLSMRGGSHRFAAALPDTPTLGYAVAGASGTDVYGGPTLVAKRDTPVTVTVRNDLRTHPLAGSMDYALMGMQKADATSPRGTLHLHGAHTEPSMDGLPDSTYLPGKGFTYRYGNDQDATGLWYHDHAWGMTRLQVTAGLAGQYWLRDSFDTGLAGNPLGLPSGSNELPLTLQDRTFNADGTFAYPVGAFATGTHPAGYPTSWAPESFGDTAIVNGKAFPNLNVSKGLYRFRMLNASNARFYNLSFDTGATFYQIGSDGGLLDRPVPLTTLRLAPAERADLLIDFRTLAPGSQLTLTNNAVAPYPSGTPSAHQGGNPLPQIMQFTVTNAPGFAGAVPTTMRGGAHQPALLPVLQATKTRTIMLNEIEDPAQPVHVMTNNQFYADSATMKPRTTGIETPALDTVEEWDIVNTTEDAHPIHLHLTQFRLVNRQTFDVAGYVAAVNQTPALVGGPGLPEPGSAGYGPFPAVVPDPYLLGSPTGPAQNETGWKDTIVAMPHQVTRIVIPFGGTAAGIPAPFTGDARDATTQHFLGTYVLHCHILEHEDNDMMQPFRVQ